MKLSYLCLSAPFAVLLRRPLCYLASRANMTSTQSNASCLVHLKPYVEVAGYLITRLISADADGAQESAAGETRAGQGCIGYGSAFAELIPPRND